jgi:hypothetical protein
MALQEIEWVIFGHFRWSAACTREYLELKILLVTQAVVAALDDAD